MYFIIYTPLKEAMYIYTPVMNSEQYVSEAINIWRQIFVVRFLKKISYIQVLIIKEWNVKFSENKKKIPPPPPQKNNKLRSHLMLKTIPRVHSILWFLLLLLLLLLSFSKLYEEFRYFTELCLFCHSALKYMYWKCIFGVIYKYINYIICEYCSPSIS